MNYIQVIHQKVACQKKNIDIITKKVENITTYLKCLKMKDGTLVINGKRKAGFIGMIISLQSVLDNFHNYYEKYGGYLLTYKLSQDHLEVYFSSVRSKGGHSNNPTAYKFIHIFKKLLIHADIRGSDCANSVLLNSSTILKVSESKLVKQLECVEIEKTDCATYECRSIDCDKNGKLIKKYHFYGPGTKYIDGVVIYIAGAILRSILRRTKCDICLVLLTCDVSKPSGSDILERKNRGGLCKPSSGVITVCKIAGKMFRDFYKSRKGIYSNLIRSTLNNIPETVLQIDHADDPHLQRLNLLKALLSKYFLIRIKHYEKQKLASVKKVRRTLTKLILFKNQ